MGPILGMLAVAAAAGGVAEDPVRDQMIDLFETLCIETFPEDAAVERLMRERGATPMTPAEVEIYLHDDPGVGWRLSAAGTSFAVTIEKPPYHACSVRVRLDREFADLGRYPAITGAYEKEHGEFLRPPPMEMDIGDVHSRVNALQRLTASGGGDSLFYFVNSPTAAAAKSGATGVEVRFVHQLAQH